MKIFDRRVHGAPTTTSMVIPERSRHRWSILLAGGDRIRLRELTPRVVGDDRPKQFCPIVGGRSLCRPAKFLWRKTWTSLIQENE